MPINELQAEQTIPKVAYIQRIFFVIISQFLFDHGIFKVLAVSLIWLVRPFG